jgi:phosphoribulokinase
MRLKEGAVLGLLKRTWFSFPLIAMIASSMRSTTTASKQSRRQGREIYIHEKQRHLLNDDYYNRFTRHHVSISHQYDVILYAHEWSTYNASSDASYDT